MESGAKRGLRLAKGAMFALSLAGCEGETVTVELEFPTLDYFLIADRAEVLAFANDGITRCPELTMRARTRTLTEAADGSTGSHPICELRDGGASLELPPGDYDLLAVATNRVGFVMVVGCTHARVGDGPRAQKVSMAILSADGRDALRDAELTCPSLRARCEGRCD